MFNEPLIRTVKSLSSSLYVSTNSQPLAQSTPYNAQGQLGTVSLNVRTYATRTWTYGYNSGTGVITSISDGAMTQSRSGLMGWDTSPPFIIASMARSCWAGTTVTMR